MVLIKTAFYVSTFVSDLKWPAEHFHAVSAGTFPFWVLDTIFPCQKDWETVSLGRLLPPSSSIYLSEIVFRFFFKKVLFLTQCDKEMLLCYPLCVLFISAHPWGSSLVFIFFLLLCCFPFRSLYCSEL